MSGAEAGASSRTTAVVRAPRDVVYAAFTDPAALAEWLSPGEMTGTVHEFDLRVGGGYTMSLYYPSSDPDSRGKTTVSEDRYTARFVELSPPSGLTQVISFDSDDAAFAGEMIMEVILEEQAGGTSVTIAFENIPPGIRPEDNDAGTRSSLGKLARFVEQVR